MSKRVSAIAEITLPASFWCSLEYLIAIKGRELRNRLKCKLSYNVNAAEKDDDQAQLSGCHGSALRVCLDCDVVPFGACPNCRGPGGAWQHVSNVNTAADGKKTDAYGPNPKGIAIFSADGHFAIIVLRNDLPKIAANNRSQATAEESLAIVRGSNALYGTYSVADKVIDLKIAQSTYPNWSGTGSKRNILSFTEREMKWSLTASIGGQSEVTWTRMR